MIIIMMKLHYAISCLCRKWKEIIKSAEIIEKKTREKFKIHLKEISQLLLIENFTKFWGF